MEQNSPEMAEFAAAVLDGYPKFSELQLLISYDLHANAEVVAAGTALDEKIYHLILWAISRGKGELLVEKALKRNPDNPKLKAFALKYGYAAGINAPAQHAMDVSAKILQTYMRPATASLASLPGSPLPAFARNAPFDSLHYALSLRAAGYFREEAFLAPDDAQRKGFRNNCFVLLLVESELPGEPEKTFALRLMIDATVPAGQLRINQHFASHIGLLPNSTRRWAIKLAPQTLSLQKVVLEPDAELADVQQECDILRQRRDDFFTHRCLFVQKQTDLESLSLYVNDKGYFRLRRVEPDLQKMQTDTLLVFGERTELELFVPLNKKAVDMVILVDVSTSMDSKDYVDANNHVGTRLMGVQKALQVLFERRLSTESRISNIAILVFSSETAALFPPTFHTMTEVKQATRPDIQKSLKMLNSSYLSDHIIYRGGTNLIAALHRAMDTFDMCSQEENERLLLLLSDGADWARNTDENRDGEISCMTDDPVEMAEMSYHHSNIHIHTIAISDELTFRKHIKDPRQFNNNKLVPNTRLLRAIAAATRGKYYESPDAKILAKLFDELGQGIVYQLTQD